MDFEELFIAELKNQGYTLIDALRIGSVFLGMPLSAQWDESKHKRASDGKFTSGSGAAPASNAHAESRAANAALRKEMKLKQYRDSHPELFASGLTEEDRAALDYLDGLKIEELRKLAEFARSRSLKQTEKERAEKKAQRAEAAKAKAEGIKKSEIDILMMERDRYLERALKETNPRLKKKFERWAHQIDAELDDLGVD